LKDKQQHDTKSLKAAIIIFQTNEYMMEKKTNSKYKERKNKKLSEPKEKGKKG